MAGSYHHCVHHSTYFPLPPGVQEGSFDYGRDDGIWCPLVENHGDASEALEEMYGMIWWLAGELATTRRFDVPDRDQLLGYIEDARQHYSDGVKLGTGQAARW